MRTCYLLLAIDVSGSMSSCAKSVREAVMSYLRKIAEMNADAVDVRYKVKILFFNDSVREHSTEFLDPSQILELLSESDFTCVGGTHIGELYEALDRIFSRKGLIGSIDKGDPLPMFLAVSDLVETDSAAMEAASRDLYDNRFFREANRLVLFVGPEDRKAAAVRLAKDEDHVMTISSALTAQLLAPVMMGSTLVMADATHLSGRQDSPRKLADDAADRDRDGQQDAEQLKEGQRLKEELEKLMRGA